MYKIIKSKRRTFAIEIKRDGAVVIRAPKRAQDADIRRVIEEKQNWIHKTRKAILEKYAQSAPKKFTHGEEFLYLGGKIKFFVDEKIAAPIFCDGESFSLPQVCLEKAKNIFIEWYKRKAYEVIGERVKYFSKNYGFKYNKIRISNAEKRWGSCTSSGNISFAWRLIMAPLPVIDYVAAHELAHIQHRNHSRRFWDKVGKIMPDYKKCRKWLRENEHLLAV